MRTHIHRVKKRLPILKNSLSLSPLPFWFLCFHMSLSLTLPPRPLCCHTDIPSKLYMCRLNGFALFCAAFIEYTNIVFDFTYPLHSSTRNLRNTHFAKLYHNREHQSTLYVICIWCLHSNRQTPCGLHCFDADAGICQPTNKWNAIDSIGTMEKNFQFSEDKCFFSVGGNDFRATNWWCHFHVRTPSMLISISTK